MKKTSKILSIVMVFALLVTSLMISTVSVQAAETVVLEWDFTEDAKDISGNGNDGVIGDGVTVADGVATFTGSTAADAGITIPDGILAGAEVVTFEFVLTPTVLSNYMTILGKGALETDWLVMTLMSDGAVRYAVVTDGLPEDKGNSTTADAGSNGTTIDYQSEEYIALNEEVTLTYIVEQEVTTVQINGEDALILNTYDKSLIGDMEGPMVLGKATKWPDPSFQGTINNFKITVGTPDAPATEEPSEDDPATEAPTTEAPATEAPATEAPATTAPATKAPSTTAPATSTASTGDSEGGFPIWIIAVIVVVVVVVVVVAVVVAKKKKK